MFRRCGNNDATSTGREYNSFWILHSAVLIYHYREPREEIVDSRVSYYEISGLMQASLKKEKSIKVMSLCVMALLC